MATPQNPQDTPASPEHEQRRELHEADVLVPLVMAICIVLGWHVVRGYENAVEQCAAVVPEVRRDLGSMRLIMAFLSVGGIGLAVLAGRESRRRRRVEEELRQAHAALGRRMTRRTQALIARGQALRESRVRERQAEREAETAFAAGQVEAAGAYLHGLGNTLSALELELLRLARDLEGAGRLETAFDDLTGRLETGDAAAAGRHAAIMRRALVERVLPRLGEREAALCEIKTRMLRDLERYRGEFERRGRPRLYVAPVRLDEELAAILDCMPRFTGHDPVTRDIAPGTVILTRRRPFLTGLAALLRQVLETPTRPVTVHLAKRAGGGVLLVMEGAPEAEVNEPAVAAFINFLNENGGRLHFEPAGPTAPSKLVVEIMDAPRS